MDIEEKGMRFSPSKTGSKTSCCALGCKSYAKKDVTVRFYKLPKAGARKVEITNKLNEKEMIDIRQVWMKRLKISKNFAQAKVCSLHFTKEDYNTQFSYSGHNYLKKTAVPSVNLPGDTPITIKNKEKIMQKSRERADRIVKRKLNSSHNGGEIKKKCDGQMIGNGSFANAANHNVEESEIIKTCDGQMIGNGSFANAANHNVKDSEIKKTCDGQMIGTGSFTNAANQNVKKSEIKKNSTKANSPVSYEQTENYVLRISARGVYSMPQANSSVGTMRDESREMMAVWPDVVRCLTDTGRHLDVPDATKWLAKVLQYNVPSGKKNRGLSLVYAYKKLAPLEQLTDDNIRLARILGWCVEMLQAYFLVLDDIMDHSQTRRGQPCWYLQNNIGLAAINDGILLEHAAYQLLRIHFKGKPCYLDLIETLQQNTMKTTFGQALDLLGTNFGQKPNLNLFTMDKYNSIVKYKTAYYSFVLPVQLAMYFAGIQDPEMHRQAKTILLEMGHFFQVQDDYLDCFGDPSITGKQGTDIQEGKCSWLVVVALQRSTSDQRRVLEECYGSEDPQKVLRVKQLYTELGLQMTYSVYEEETYNLLNTHIQQISRGLPHDMFFKFLDKIYRRDS